MLAPTNSLERALRLLETVAHRSDGYSHSELSRKLGIPSSSCSYVLARLTREHYLNRDAEGRYTIGLKTLILSDAALRRLGLRPFAEPVLYQLVEETQLAASIGVLEGARVLLVQRAESSTVLNGNLQLPLELRDFGVDLPLHTTGLGKVLLAGLDRAQLDKALDVEGLPKIASIHAIDSATRLMADIKCVQERGYAMVRGEHRAGFWSMAAPVLGIGGKTRAAVALTGTPEQPAWADVEGLASRLVQAAKEISRNMRFRDMELANSRRAV